VRKCKHCKTAIPKHAESLTAHHKAGFCSGDHYYQGYVIKNREAVQRKAQRVRDKQDREQRRKFKDNDLSHQKRLTQKVFNRMICLLDKDQGCISCDKPASWQGQWHASHLFSVGSHPHLRYDARNVWKSCSVCNAHLSGNIGAYRDRLRDRYPGIIELLESLQGPLKATCQDLIAMRKEYASEVRRLEKGEKPSKDWREL
jgi:hypothetical protein